MFVIPTIYTAVDRYTRTVGVMGKATTSFADRASAAGARIERSLNKFGDKALNVAKTTAVAGGAIIAPLALATNAAIKFEDKMADVAKTSGITGVELSGLGKDLLSMSGKTRTSIEGLQQIAEIGGQFGIKGRKGILEFTESVNKFNVALGSDFSGGVEEAARAIGRLNVLFKETKDLTVADSITKVGSAINALSAKGVQVPELTEFISRIGQLPDAIKPSIQDVAALGAVFNKTGITAEISSRAVGDVLMTAAANIPAFAKQMRTGEAAVRNLINTNPTEFLKRFATSLQGMNATDFTKATANLKLADSGSLKVIGALSTSTEMLTGFQKLANDEFAKGTSLLDEYNTKNNTTAGRLAQAKNNLEALAITVGTQLLPMISKFLDKVLPIVTAIGDWMTKHEALMGVIVPAVATFGGILLVLSGFATAVGVVTKGIAAWEIVQKVLNGTMKANPIGVILTVIGLLIVAIEWVVSNTEGWGKQWDATVSWMGSIFKAFQLDFRLKLLQIKDHFWTMVDAIVGAWYWAQNKIGMITDEQYNKNIALIEAEKAARVKAIKDTADAYNKEMAKVTAGPGWHVTMKDDRKDAPGEVERGGVALPALAPTADVRQNVLMQSIAPKEKDKLEVVVKAAPGTDAAVGNNTLGLPKLSSTMGFQNQK